jgi:hypothetical protein
MTSIQMIIEEVKRLSNLYENKIPSVLLFETLFKAKEMHKQEHRRTFIHGVCENGKSSKEKFEQYYLDTFKKN